MLLSLINTIRSIYLLFATSIVASEPQYSISELFIDKFEGLPQPKFCLGQTVQQVFISGALEEPEDKGKEYWSVGRIVGLVWNNPYAGHQGWSYAVLWSLFDGELRQEPHFAFQHETDLLLLE